MKKNNFLMLLASVFLLLNCKSDSLSFIDEKDSLPVLSRVDSTGMYKMKDVPVFKNYLQQNLSSTKFKSDNFSNLFQGEQLVDVVNKNGRVSYSTFLKTENNIFQIFVYSIGKNESFFIVEYISASPVQYFELAKFTGTVHYKTAEGETLGKENFENGKPVKKYS